ncbi:MAG: hypothetical protein AAFX65_05975 [Cyanobacteria bacterium J06638_7]
MRKLLWCGGSHLAHAKEAIDSHFSDFKNIFWLTAGPANRDWFNSGGRYLLAGDVVEDPRTKAQVKVGEFAHIVFIGQYINLQFFRANSQIVSRALYRAIYPFKTAPFELGGLCNHPLQLFFTNFGEQCVLMPEPMPVSDSGGEITPLKTREYYREMLKDFCLHYNSLLAEEDPALLDENGLTFSIFQGKDRRHCNSQYWHLRMKSLRASCIIPF